MSACLRLLARRLAVLALAGALPGIARAQTPGAPADVPAEAPVVSVNELEAPASPAFTILGVSPSSVDRPRGVKGVVVSALSSLTTSEGFPRNYALEVAPYWFASHPAKNFKDYYAAGPLTTMAQHFSVSVATAPIEDGAPTAPGTSIAIGGRTLLAAGDAHPFLERTLGQMDGFYRAYLRATEVTPLLRVLRSARVASRRTLSAAGQVPAFKDLAEELEAHEEDVRDAADRLAKATTDAERENIAKEQAALNAALPALQAKALDRVLARSPEQLRDRAAALDELSRLLAEAGVAARSEGVPDVSAKIRAALSRWQAAMAQGPASTIADAETILVLDEILTTLETARARDAAAAEAKLRSLLLEVQAFDLQRVGFMASAAGAVAWDVPGDVSDRTQFAKAAIWLTPAYRFVVCPSGSDACESGVEATGVVRYTRDSRAATPSEGLELGGRVSWMPRAKIVASVEAVHSYRDDLEDANRVVGVFEYRLTDAAFLYASFGKDFKEANVRRNLVSIVGLTFGFGRQPILKPVG